MAVRDSVTEFLREFTFSFMLWYSLFLVKFQAFITNNCLNQLNKGCYELKKKTSSLIEISMREISMLYIVYESQ